MAEVIDMSYTQEQQEDMVEELVTRGIDAIYPTPQAFTEELLSGRRLTAYMGIDPTAPDLHIGHESQLLKLHRLQQLGHRVILLIGDFTGLIGDPTDKSAGRVKQTREEVLANAVGYKQQAGKILDFEHPSNPIELKYNSEWLGAMSFADVLELASEFTVQQMLERDVFEKRIAEGKPVGVHEFLYPMMQAWDSVCMDVDIEVGGSDQIFNMLVGSTLQRRRGRQKYVIAGQLLVDPSGKKMGKTEGNMVTLNDSPVIMYQKVMRWGDAIVPHALELCTTMPMTEIERIRTEMEDEALSGIAAKKMLAGILVTKLHSAEAAVVAEQEYKVLSSKNPTEYIDQTSVDSFEVQGNTSLVNALAASGIATSKSAARRLIESGAVRLDGQKIADSSYVLTSDDNGRVLSSGRKALENFRKLVIAEIPEG